MYHFDPCINQCELEFQMIIHLENLANQLLDGFTVTNKVIKSHISIENTPARLMSLKDN